MKKKKLCDNIIKNIKLLNKQIIVSTLFDDKRICYATEIIKKRRRH